VIEVQVEDAPELSGNYRVNQEGSIPMKFLGSLPVVGRTTEDVATMVANGLRGRYLRNPQVYVAVRQYNSRTFFIQGAVRTPGLYIIEERPTLFKLITLAGGLVERHAPTAFIIRESRPTPEKLERARAGLSAPDANSSEAASAGRRTPTELAQHAEQLRASRPAVEGETEYELITAQISGLFRGNFEQNLVIQPNDLVFIPPAEVFFVAGEVKAPGQFPLREGTTLRQAISLAQGTLFNAAANRTIIFRQDPLTGKLEEMLVDVAAVMSGKHEDVGIMPNDVIMIPNSRLKTVGGSLVRGMGMGIAQAMLWTIFR
jgi:polysaccharide export outer membrane protein